MWNKVIRCADVRVGGPGQGAEAVLGEEGTGLGEGRVERPRARHEK